MSGDWWAVDDPVDGLSTFDDERDARAHFDFLVGQLREESVDGWHEDAETCALYRLVPVARLCLVITARAEDDSAEGKICREQGWDYTARGDVVSEPDPVGDLLAVILGDGGHRRAEVGTEQAAREALERVQEMRQRLAEALAEVELLRALLAEVQRGE